MSVTLPKCSRPVHNYFQHSYNPVRYAGLDESAGPIRGGSRPVREGLDAVRDRRGNRAVLAVPRERSDGTPDLLGDLVLTEAPLRDVLAERVITDGGLGDR